MAHDGQFYCLMNISMRVIVVKLTPNEQLFLAIPWREQVTFNDMVMISAQFLRDQQALYLDFYCTSSLKQ